MHATVDLSHDIVFHWRHGNLRRCATAAAPYLIIGSHDPCLGRMRHASVSKLRHPVTLEVGEQKLNAKYTRDETERGDIEFMPITHSTSRYYECENHAMPL